MERTLLSTACGNGTAQHTWWDYDAQQVVKTSETVTVCEPYTIEYNTLIDAWCDGTTRVEVRAGSRQDVFYVNTPNSEICAIPPCGLVIDAVEVELTDATGNNATATIYASGYAFTLEYSLNGFVDVQDSPIFPGLTVGSYTAYVRGKGSNSCSAWMDFVVEPERGERFHVVFKDAKERSVRVGYWKKGYTGPSEELRGAGDVLTIDWPGAGNKNTVVQGSGATITILLHREGLVEELHTADEREYRVDITIDTVLEWRGYHLPDVYYEPWLAVETWPAVSLTAADGLATLSEVPYLTDFGQRYFGRAKSVETLFRCLRKLDLNLPVYLGVNIYEDRMDPLLEPLAQSYVDQSSYHEKDWQGRPCKEVLEWLLAGYSAYIRQSKGAIHVIRFPEQKGPYQRRLADMGTSDITARYNISSALFEDLHLILRNGAVSYREARQAFDARPALKRASVKVEYGELENFIRNADFEEWSTGEPLWWERTAAVERRVSPKGDSFMLAFTEIKTYQPTSAYIKSTPAPEVAFSEARLRFVFDYYIQTPDSLGHAVFFKIQIKIGDQYLKNDSSLENNTLRMGFAWTTEPSFVGATIRPTGSGDQPTTTEGSREFIFPKPTVLGEITVTVMEPSVSWPTTDGISVAIDNIKFTEHPLENIEAMIIRGENPGYITSKPLEMVLHHGSRVARSQALITLADGVPSRTWDGGKLLQEIMLREILEQHIQPTLVLQGTATGPLTPISVVTDPYRKGRFVVDKYTYRVKPALIDFDAQQVFGGEDDFLYMLHEDGTVMLYEDGTPMLYETE